MAFAALISLTNTTEQNLHHHLLPDKQQIKTLLQEANFLQNFLENSLQKDNEKVERLEIQIRDAAHGAEDIIESHLLDGLLSNSASYAVESSTTFNEALENVMEEIQSIKQEMMKFEEEIGIQDLQPMTSLGAVSSKPGLSGESTMLGLADELEEIRTRLVTGSSKLQIISIVGMGGIGTKTTMAKNIYDHLSIKYHFDIRGWVTVSQEYNEGKVILDILDSMKMLPDNMRNESSDKLKGVLHKTLSGMRYLIVLDDIWDKKAWDNVNRLLSNDSTNGSRIILTTRLKEVADHAKSCPPIHQARFLYNFESWKLFCDTVFGLEGCCPPELDEIGKRISQNCRGLPLSIVVIGGLLSNGIKTEHYWRKVLGNLSSTITSNDEQSLKVLSLSYKCLPHHLKGCLLYMGIFPEDSEVSVFELVNLWAAEGIIKPISSKSLEDVGEEYLLDLVEINLVSSGKKNSMGKIKTCKIHDLLRDLCVRQSKKEMFFHTTYWHFSKSYYMLKDFLSRSRRIIVPKRIKFIDWHADQPLSISLPRSFLYFLSNDLSGTINDLNLRLVRVFYSCIS